MTGVPSIGFAIVSHADPEQLARLVETLNAVYDRPAIACHHDSHQSAIDHHRFPANVSFVVPAIRTGWAKFSTVQAGLAALRLLYRDDGPDWFFLLSAADYPIRDAEKVRAELGRAPCDAYMDVRPIVTGRVGRASYVGEHNPKLDHFAIPSNRRLKRQFFQHLQLWVPILRRDPRWRIGRYTVWPRIPAPHPFGKTFHALYGDHWFCANRRAAQVLLAATPAAERLQRHLRRRSQVDEGYYQMILGNTPGLTICRDNKRFAEWRGGGAHPITLTEAQLAEAFHSGAFFARKFAPGSPVLAEVDKALGIVKMDA